MYQIDKSKHLNELETLELKTRLSSGVIPLKGTMRHLTALELLSIELLLHTGARTTELLNLTVDDFDFTHHQIFVRGIKGSDNRSVPVSPKLMEKAKSIFGEQMLVGNIRPFKFTDRHLRNVWYSVRPCNKSAHSLRHSFAISIYKQFRDIRLVQCLLGHRNINNTLVYSSYVFTSEEITKIAGQIRI